MSRLKLQLAPKEEIEAQEIVSDISTTEIMQTSTVAEEQQEEIPAQDVTTEIAPAPKEEIEAQEIVFDISTGEMMQIATVTELQQEKIQAEDC